MRILFTAFLAIVITSSMVSSSWADLKEAIEAYYENRYGVALREFQPLAEEGVVEAQFYLGVMYAKGRGIAQNYAEAVRWYRLAAEQGFVKAMSNLGSMYSNGYGLPKDYALAIRWYQEAADEDLPEAQYNLGVMHKEGKGMPRDLVKAYMWFNLSAGQGYEDADRARKLVARMMTPEEIAQGQGLARAWRDKKVGCSPATAPCP